MFAPKVAKPQAKAAANSMLVARPFGGGAVEQAHMLQRSIGNQATLRLLAQRFTGNVPHGHNEQEAHPTSRTTRGATPDLSWDFSKIPLFPPDRADLHQTSSPMTAKF
jgi:hypothetical protein